MTDRPFFNASEARNLGVAAATGAWLLMIDADVVVAPHFLDAVRPHLQDGCYVIPPDPIQEAGGTTLVTRADMAAIGGYDPVFEGYGSEDRDIRTRLEAAGSTAAGDAAGPGPVCPPRRRSAWPLPPNHRRQPQHDHQPRLLARQNPYLAALGVTLGEPERRALYARIRHAAATAADGLEEHRDRSSGEDDIRGARLPMSLRYRLQ